MEDTSSRSASGPGAASTATNATTLTTACPAVISTVSPPSTQTVALFSRHFFSLDATLSLCHAFASTTYPGLSCHPSQPQGYCSYTLAIDEDLILQFRPSAHTLNISLSSLAREVYGALAPQTHSLGVIKCPSASSGEDLPLHVYSMTRIPGLSLANFRLALTTSPTELRAQRNIIVRDFARFLATGWAMRKEWGSVLPANRGRLGTSLRWRLGMMRDRLPSRFRPVVEDVLGDLTTIEMLPWVLTHGDINSDNLMVEGRSWNGKHGGTGWSPGSLRGLLDWAESEYLPFGIGLYGVEELLGQSVRYWHPGKQTDGEAKSRFAYYAAAEDLRRSFWNELQSAIPALGSDPGFRLAVEQARLLGILLWHGFAFDDGKLDRVVEEGRDDEEIQRLDLFLLGTSHPTMVSNDISSENTTTHAVEDSQEQQRLLDVAPDHENGAKADRGWSFLRTIHFLRLPFRRVS